MAVPQLQVSYLPMLLSAMEALLYCTVEQVLADGCCSGEGLSGLGKVTLRQSQHKLIDRARSVSDTGRTLPDGS